MKLDLATVAQYFRVGLEIGSCQDDQVRDWAFFIIGEFDDPPQEIVELSWHFPRSRVLDNLNAVKGNADMQAVGEWLLAAIGASMTADGNLHQYLRQAFYVVRATNLSPDTVYYTLDGIADDLQLAEIGLAGDVETCRQELNLLLAQYSPVPFVGGWTGFTFDVTH